MKIGITGATGLVGNNLCRKLLEFGHKINVLIRNEKSVAIRNLNVDKFIGDLNTINVLESFCHGCDIIIHSAALISIGKEKEEQVYEINTLGTKNVIDAAINNHVKKFIYISSINAYNKFPLNQSINEKSDLVEKGAAYDVSKSKAQQLVLKSNNIDTLVINPTAVIGPNDFKPSLLGSTILDYYHNKMPFILNGGLDIIDARDLTNAVLKLIHLKKSKETYILSGKWYSFKEIIGTIKSINQSKKFIITVPLWYVKFMFPIINLFGNKFLLFASKVNGYFIPGLENLTKESLYNIIYFNKNIDNSKAKKELDLKIRPLRETLKDYVKCMT